MVKFIKGGKRARHEDKAMQITGDFDKLKIDMRELFKHYTGTRGVGYNINTELGKIAKEEAKDMKSRLSNSTGVARKVGRDGNFSVQIEKNHPAQSKGKMKFKELSVGTDRVMGEKGTRAENVDLTDILKEGHGTPAAVGQGKQSKYRFEGKGISKKIRDRKFAYGGNWGSQGPRSRGAKIKIGYRGKAVKPNPLFIEKGVENVTNKINNRIPKVLKDSLLKASLKTRSKK